VRNKIKLSYICDRGSIDGKICTLWGEMAVTRENLSALERLIQRLHLMVLTTRNET